YWMRTWATAQSYPLKRTGWTPVGSYWPTFIRSQADAALRAATPLELDAPPGRRREVRTRRSPVGCRTTRLQHFPRVVCALHGRACHRCGGWFRRRRDPLGAGRCVRVRELDPAARNGLT